MSLLILWIMGGFLAYIFTVKHWYKKYRYIKPFTFKDKILIHLLALFLFSGGWVGLVIYFKCSK